MLHLMVPLKAIHASARHTHPTPLPVHLLQFVATRIKPVLRKAQNAEVGDLVRGTGTYLRGLWSRLNGGGSRVQEPALSPDLPLPKSSSAKETELVGGAWLA